MYTCVYMVTAPHHHSNISHLWSILTMHLICQSSLKTFENSNQRQNNQKGQNSKYSRSLGSKQFHERKKTKSNNTKY